jgi:LuxR family transcriptional regulator, maltose regulon positive regulatory protein
MGDNALIMHHYHLAEAQLALNRGDQAAALAALRRGLALAPHVPLCHLYVWRPAVLARLMALALEHDIEPDAAAKVIRERSLEPPWPLRAGDRWPRRFRVLMLGCSSVARDGVSIGNRHRSPLALLHCLIWHGGREVGIDILAGDLWPDKEGPKAQQALDVTLLRLRRLVDDRNAIIVARRTVTLAPSLWWSDLGEFREVVQAILAEAAPRRADTDAARITTLQSRLLALYRGDLLPGAVGLPGAGGSDWVEDARNKTRELFARALFCLGGFWERVQEPVEAENCYCRALEMRPHSERLRARLQAVRSQTAGGTVRARPAEQARPGSYSWGPA